jgi:type I restriction enzyme, S subunit
MNSNKNTPAIRFKGFNDAWEHCEVGEIFKVTRGYVLPVSATSPQKSDATPYPVYSSQTQNDGLMGYYKDYLFDTAITWTTDGANAGTVSFRVGKFYSTNVNGVLLSDKGYVNKCIAEALNLIAWKHVSHVGNPKLMNNVMSEIKIIIPPTVHEQESISQVLSNLDNLINLHQRKQEKLKQLKKALLEKMFPKATADTPEIRFKGFTDAWEQHNIKELGKIFIGLVTTMTTNYTDKGTLLIRNSDIKENKFVFSDTPIFLESKFALDNSTRMLKIGDVVTVHTGDVGTSSVIREKEENSIGFATINTRPNQNIIDSDYLSCYLNTDGHKSFAFNMSTGDGRTNYNLKEFNQVVVPVPSLLEQRKIASVILAINNLITLHQRKHEKLQHIKKALLQNMFV